MIKEQKPQGYYTDKVFTPADMDKAIAKEREACANVCDGLKKKEQAHWSAYGFDGSYYSASDCATAIRARGQQ